MNGNLVDRRGGAESVLKKRVEGGNKNRSQFKIGGLGACLPVIKKKKESELLYQKGYTVLLP